MVVRGDGGEGGWWRGMMVRCEQIMNVCIDGWMDG